MSQLNTSLPDFRNYRIHVRNERAPRNKQSDLQVLARDPLLKLIPKAAEMSSGHTAEAVAKPACNTCVKDTVKGCADHLSDAEYQHLVELGHWHHRRQRRRNRRL